MAATSAPPAPTSSATRGDHVSASQPASGPPIGVEPRKTIEYSAITRPRISGVTASCSAEFTPAANVTLTAPSGTRTTAASSMVGATASSRMSTPNSPDERTSSRLLTRPRAPATSAPTTEPIPIAIISDA